MFDTKPSIALAIFISVIPSLKVDSCGFLQLQNSLDYIERVSKIILSGRPVGITAVTKVLPIISPVINEKLNMQRLKGNTIWLVIFLSLHECHGFG